MGDMSDDPFPDTTPPAARAQDLGPAPSPAPHATEPAVPALSLRGLTKRYGEREVVHAVDLDVPAGSMYGLVGRNGAGKTTTLSMATGLLRPDAGAARVRGLDVWQDPLAAKALLGVLPDGVHLFDRLTGRQLISYAGLLHGLDRETVAGRAQDLLVAMDLADAAEQAVTDYSAGMRKKIALAAAMVHAPSLLVLDEPFEAVDPVSASNIRDILAGFVRRGGTVIVSSHVMDLVQRLCDHVAIMGEGTILAAGTVEEVRGEQTLEDRFVDLVGGRVETEGISWLGTS